MLNTIKTIEDLLKEFYLDLLTFLIPKLLDNSLASCSLINFNFSLPHTEPFSQSIILSFFVFTTLGFLLSVFFQHFKQYDNIVI